jgi:hypothetical protein
MVVPIIGKYYRCHPSLKNATEYHRATYDGRVVHESDCFEDSLGITNEMTKFFDGKPRKILRLYNTCEGIIHMKLEGIGIWNWYEWMLVEKDDIKSIFKQIKGDKNDR